VAVKYFISVLFWTEKWTCVSMSIKNLVQQEQTVAVAHRVWVVQLASSFTGAVPEYFHFFWRYVSIV